MKKQRRKTYICDPCKNEGCRKTACQTLCFRTRKKENKASGMTWVKHKIAEIRKERR